MKAIIIMNNDNYEEVEINTNINGNTTQMKKIEIVKI